MQREDFNGSYDERANECEEKDVRLSSENNLISASQRQLLGNSSREEDGNNLREFLSWGVKIQPSHLDDHCHGVNVSCIYIHITEHWKSGGFITATTDNQNFQLEIKKINGRTTIHSGWKKMVDFLKAKEGDICLFYNLGSPTKFKVKLQST
ncbi:hypothetical protein DCAR_0623478 [Daucus carota subsp. sativus]|uniref:Uncharacterized protein n=1 Tax=Daucus carota subsp. sativus TaxID=79200 RepID=A0A175YBI7_DAUCS|nr:hypothetical protein DCAR_0623478 [Daucus carota subsp. sativus]